MPHQDLEDQRSWWKLVLSGLLAIVFGVAAIVLPVQILSARVLDLIFGLAKPFSASMSAVAALLALIALVAIDGLVNLFGTGIAVKRASTIRGVVGVAVAIAAVFWPDQTVAAAVELIGIWAIVIGILELLFARYASENAKQRALLIIAGIASVAIGVGMMRKVFIGAVLVSVFVGIAAAARGISLIILGFSRRVHREHKSEAQVIRRNAA